MKNQLGGLMTKFEPWYDGGPIFWVPSYDYIRSKIEGHLLTYCSGMATVFREYKDPDVYFYGIFRNISEYKLQFDHVIPRILINKEELENLSAREAFWNHIYYQQKGVPMMGRKGYISLLENEVLLQKIGGYREKIQIGMNEIRSVYYNNEPSMQQAKRICRKLEAKDTIKNIDCKEENFDEVLAKLFGERWKKKSP